MPYPRDLLHDREELVLDLKPHWLFMFLPSSLLGLAVIVGLLVAVGDWEPDWFDAPAAVIALVALVAALGYFGWKYLSWTRTEFVLTTDRVITREGVLSKSGIEIPLERINTVFFKQGVLERMMGAGDLDIESAGERGTEHFHNVRKPHLVQREIYVQMEQNENRKFDRVRDPTLSTAEQIEKLHALMEKGAITPAQFEAEKAKLLGG